MRTEDIGVATGKGKVQKNKLSKEFGRSSREIKKIIARNILKIFYFFFKVSINNLNHFQSYSKLFSQIDHVSIIAFGISIKHLLKISPISNGTS